MRARACEERERARRERERERESQSERERKTERERERVGERVGGVGGVGKGRQFANCLANCLPFPPPRE